MINLLGVIKDSDQDSEIDDVKDRVHQLFIRIRALENEVARLKQNFADGPLPPIMDGPDS